MSGVMVDSNLVEIINEIFPDLKCTIDHIKHPQQNFVEQIWTEILKYVFNQPNDDFLKMTAAQRALYTVPEAMARTAWHINIFKLFRKLMAPPNDITLLDVINPTGTRTLKILRSAVNYILFMENVTGEIINSEMNEWDKYKTQGDELLKKQSDLRMSIERKQSECNDGKYCKNDVVQLQNKIQTLQEVKNNLEKEMTVALAKEETLDAEISEVNESTAQLLVKRDNLAAQKCDDVPQIDRRLEQLRQTKIDVEENMTETRNMLDSKKKTNNLFEKLISIYSDCSTKNTLLFNLTTVNAEVRHQLTQGAKFNAETQLSIDKLSAEVKEAEQILSKTKIELESVEADFKTAQKTVNADIDKFNRELDQLKLAQIQQTDHNHKLTVQRNKLQKLLSIKEQEYNMLMDDYDHKYIQQKEESDALREYIDAQFERALQNSVDS